MRRKWIGWIGVAVVVVLVAGGVIVAKPRPVPRPANELVVRLNPDDVVAYPGVMAKGGEKFADVMKCLKPYAAINGTYYDRDFKPEGDIIAGGKLLNKGKRPSAFVVTKSGHAAVVWRKDASFASSGYDAVLAAGPRLIRDGKVQIDPEADGFSMKALEVVAPRSGVGVTREGIIVLVVDRDPVRLADFAEHMWHLGCIEAINLDGGPACGLYYKGKTLCEPTLPMTNMLVFDEKPEVLRSAGSE